MRCSSLTRDGTRPPASNTVLAPGPPGDVPGGDLLTNTSEFTYPYNGFPSIRGEQEGHVVAKILVVLNVFIFRKYFCGHLLNILNKINLISFGEGSHFQVW